MIEIKAYKCEFCNKKIYQAKSSAVRHEKQCYANPIMKACRSCDHLIKISNTVYVPPHGDQNYGDSDYEEIILHCLAKDKTIKKSNCHGEFEVNCYRWKDGGGDSFQREVDNDY
jgi:hypothetical protein